MGTVLNETMPFALVSLSTEGKIKNTILTSAFSAIK